MHLTAEQIEIRDTVRAFVRDEIKPVTLHPRRLEPFAKPLLTDLLAAASKLGLRALSLSEACGGAGADALTACIVSEELAQGDADIAVVMAHTTVLGRLSIPESRSIYLSKPGSSPWAVSTWSSGLRRNAACDCRRLLPRTECDVAHFMSLTVALINT